MAVEEGRLSGNVSLETRGRVALITVDNPPVNALSHAVRAGIAARLDEIAARDDVDAVVLACAGRTFIAGADIREFNAPPREPHLPDLVDRLESFKLPIVAAIHGTALGGGLEIALGCHYRVALSSARLGLPEVKLGLLPGAGGTQRLPRAVGPETALEMIVTGRMIAAKEAHGAGLLDAVVEDDLIAEAIGFAAARAERNAPIRRLSKMDEKLEACRRDPSSFEGKAQKMLARAKGLDAPVACVEAVRNTLTMDFVQGQKRERELFAQLKQGEQSKAQRHLFFAERKAQKVPGIDRQTGERDIRKIAVLGAGTMGSGIAMAFASAGLPVVLIDPDDKARERARATIESNYQKSAERGRITPDMAERALTLVSMTGDFTQVAEADLVIEAVFEDMALKKKVFADLDRHAKEGAILASNTSYLDLDEIATATSRPRDVVGMHFFSPANVMRLLEVVRATQTAPDVLATVIGIGRKLGKVSVTVGLAYGFVGNRMLLARNMEVENLLLEGARPQEIDAAATEFGFAMGPCAVGDLSGLDIGWRARKAAGLKGPVADALCERGRFGQKTGQGYYRYEDGSRTPLPDPETEALIDELAAERGITRRPIERQAITERLILPLINEAAHILTEGVALRGSDIDLIWVNGYGFPRAKGGPAFHADQLGLDHVVARLEHHAGGGNERTKPAPLLTELAQSGKRLSEYEG